MITEAITSMFLYFLALNMIQIVSLENIIGIIKYNAVLSPQTFFFLLLKHKFLEAQFNMKLSNFIQINQSYS